MKKHLTISLRVFFVVLLSRLLMPISVDAQSELYGWGRYELGQSGFDSWNPRQTIQDEDWEVIAVGGQHVLGIKTNGTLWAWGANDNGQLGDGTISAKGVPVQVGSDDDWAVISAGYTFSLALKTNGTLWAWGRNSLGQLGDGTTIEKTVPVQIGIDTDWAYIAAGGNHVVALKTTGSLWAWGYNIYGQVGNSSTTNRLSPVQIGAQTNWKEVSAGADHTIALTTAGRIYSWGRNTYGQLGNNTTTQSNSPTLMDMATDWKTIAASRSEHSLALKNDGTLWAWGRNNYRQLGDGTSVQQRNVPTKIGTATDWSRIAGCTNHSMGQKTDGTLWVWGYNYYGQLGDGTSVQRSVPTKLGTTSDWRYFGLGSHFSIALKNDRTLWAWGINVDGQQGDGTSGALSSPRLIGSADDWVKIATVAKHSLGIKGNGTLWAWGYNHLGRLGDFSTNNRNIPFQIGTDTDWITIACGQQHSLAIKNDNSLWVWGNNLNGEHGDGMADIKYAPTKIGTENDWKFITGGYYHTVAIKTNGTLWAWGQNSWGQLGDGSTTNRNTPVQIGELMPEEWLMVAAGEYHTVGLRADGTLWAWGQNSWGQLGIGDDEIFNTNIPVQIGTAANWKSVATSGRHNAAIKNDGTLWAWGENYFGQLGDGTTERKFSPVQVGTATDWKHVITGIYHTLAIKNDGTLWAWGANQGGQLGDGTRIDKLSPVKAGIESGWSLIAGGEDHSIALMSGCTNPVNGGTIASNHSICIGTAPSLLYETIAPSGLYTGTLQYQWQSSSSSAVAGFYDISGATSSDYQPGALEQTTWYKRLVKTDCESSWVESNALEVTVNPLLRYRSKAGLDYASPRNWTTTANWEQFNGTAWVDASSYPGQISNSCASPMVTIQANHQMEIPNGIIIIIPNLKVESGAKSIVKPGGKLDVRIQLQLDKQSGAAIVVE